MSCLDHFTRLSDNELESKNFFTSRMLFKDLPKLGDLFDANWATKMFNKADEIYTDPWLKRPSVKYVVLDTLVTSQVSGGCSGKNGGNHCGAVVAISISLPGYRCPVFCLTTFQFRPGVPSLLPCAHSPCPPPPSALRRPHPLRIS